MLRFADESDRTEPARYSILRICLIMAVAAYGALVVQNVTGMLKDIVHNPVFVQTADRPSR